MDIRTIVKQLSNIERAAIGHLARVKACSVEELASGASLHTDSARRAANWLAEKNLVKLDYKTTSYLVLTKKGADALKQGLPEKLLAEMLLSKGSVDLKELASSFKGQKDALSVALGISRREGWGVLRDGVVHAGKRVDEVLKQANRKVEMLKQAAQGSLSYDELTNTQRTVVQELLNRGLLEREERKHWWVSITKQGMKAAALLEKIKERTFVLDAPVEPLFVGKRQPYARFLQEVKRRLVELGFKEMPAPLITQEFYNFDVLFQPQDHPARAWSDTYKLRAPKLASIKNKDAVKRVKAIHEYGGSTGSKGWQQPWSEKLASKLMPAAHGTAHSALQLLKGVQVPGKYFTLARCFRPDVIDRTHLIEFNQLEGFIVGDFTFPQLLGILKQFAVEIAGAEQVRFYPDYYPFTEPSVQLSAKHPDFGWMEFGGAGMFRPEVMAAASLKCNALAWGLGIDRLAMFKLGIEDVRELFTKNLKWLREARIVRGVF